MILVEDWNLEIEKSKNLNPVEKEKLFFFSKLFDEGNFHGCYDFYWQQLDDYLRAVVPEIWMREINLEVFD